MMHKYQELFNYMQTAHGLTLIQSEMDEIIAIVDRIAAPGTPCKSCNATGVNLLNETCTVCKGIGMI